MQTIQLTQGKTAVVDDEMFQILNQYRWYVGRQHRQWYAMRAIKWNGKNKTIYMHHCVLGYPLNKNVIDHIDGNGLNNQRSNLRMVNQTENKWNSQKQQDTLNPYKGVTLSSPGRWSAHIKIDKRTIHLGTFDSCELAAQKYDKAALSLHGEFAQPNFPKATYNGTDLSDALKVQPKTCDQLREQELLRCYDCSAIKPFGDFYKDKSSGRGFSVRCKPCARAQSASNYQVKAASKKSQKNIRKNGIGQIASFCGANSVLGTHSWQIS